nr:hypothetical protein [uncultured Oscillibacter sp.]
MLWFSAKQIIFAAPKYTEHLPALRDIRWANLNQEVQQTNDDNSGFADLLFLSAYHQIALTDVRRKPDPPQATQ